MTVLFALPFLALFAAPTLVAFGASEWAEEHPYGLPIIGIVAALVTMGGIYVALAWPAVMAVVPTAAGLVTAAFLVSVGISLVAQYTFPVLGDRPLYSLVVAITAYIVVVAGEVVWLIG